MMVQSLTSVTRDAESEKDTIDPAKLISGAPETQTWNAFSNDQGNFHVGHWSSGPCKLKVSYTENELCLLLEGRVILTDLDGNTQTYKAGEPFVIKSGFEGTWESIGRVTKLYAINEG